MEKGLPYMLWGKADADWGAFTLTVDRVEGLPRLNSLRGESIERYGYSSMH